MALWNKIMSIFGLGKPCPAPGPGGAVDEKDKIGQVEAFLRKLSVAVVKVEKGALNLQDNILIKGHTTDFKMEVRSMQINHKSVTTVKAGQSAGIKVPKRVRRGDVIYKAG